jgi:ABC-type uncharacterized transport system substrate-binding protein
MSRPEPLGEAMRRRDFIALIGGAAAEWPLVVRAQQQPEQVRRIGALINRPADDPQGQAGMAAFRQKLQELGWSEARNVRIEIRWGENDVDRTRRYAAELAELTPDVALAAGTVAVTALQHISRSLPIVFVGVSDPVGAGVVDSLARPGGNATGFMNFRIQFEREVVGAPQANRAGGKASSGLSRSGDTRRHWSVQRDPSHSAIARRGGECYRHT